MILCELDTVTLILVLIGNIRLPKTIAALLLTDFYIVLILVFLLEWFPLLEAAGEHSGLICLPYKGECDLSYPRSALWIDYPDSLPS